MEKNFLSRTVLNLLQFMVTVTIDDAVLVTTTVTGMLPVLASPHFLQGLEQGGAGEEEPDAPFMDAVVKVRGGGVTLPGGIFLRTL